jgi:hypothetical protein
MPPLPSLGRCRRCLMLSFMFGVKGLDGRQRPTHDRWINADCCILIFPPFPKSRRWSFDVVLFDWRSFSFNIAVFVRCHHSPWLMLIVVLLPPPKSRRLRRRRRHWSSSSLFDDQLREKKSTEFAFTYPPLLLAPTIGWGGSHKPRRGLDHANQPLLHVTCPDTPATVVCTLYKTRKNLGVRAPPQWQGTGLLFLRQNWLGK